VIKIDGLFISTVKVLFASVLCSGTTGYVHFILDQQFAPGLISSNTHLGNAVLLCISAICGTLLYFFALVLSGFDPLPGFRQWFVQWNIRSSLSIFIFTFNKFLKSSHTHAFVCEGAPHLSECSRGLLWYLACEQIRTGSYLGNRTHYRGLGTAS